MIPHTLCRSVVALLAVVLLVSACAPGSGAPQPRAAGVEVVNSLLPGSTVVAVDP